MQRIETRSQKSTSEKFYRRIPVDNLIRPVHNARVNESVGRLPPEPCPRNQIQGLSGPVATWTSHIFYVNPYYVDISDMYDYMEE